MLWQKPFRSLVGVKCRLGCSAEPVRCTRGACVQVQVRRTIRVLLLDAGAYSRINLLDSQHSVYLVYTIMGPAYYGHCWTLLQRKPEIHIENYNFIRRSLTDAERFWIRMWSSPSPPNSYRKPEFRSLLGSFLFWFQRGLALAAALQRLTTGSKSVSERHLSLTERPTAPESRLEKMYHLQ